MEGVHLTALALLVLFGANWVLFCCLWLHRRLSCRVFRGGHCEVVDALVSQRVTDGDGGINGNASDGDAVTPAGAGTAATATAAVVSSAAGGHGKVLSGPLARTLTSVRAFSAELSRLGLVITFAYLCEHHPPFPHNKKVHDMDMFWCVALMLLVSSALNVRKSKGGDVLSREQTEEWKGWMQFMFLMYHYFSAHEVYNSIRVFITAYVWMTGFGNFSFFYLKGDYGAVRLLQMLWRLNFLVILLCMAMDNHYILYYICPLHTFYFFVVYAIMRPAKWANYTQDGMRYKLLIAGAVIFCVWDWDLEIFDKVFFFLGRKPVIGAGGGTMWEWYFRTSLDHWSTFLGMIFALNYPATAQWVKRLETLPMGRQWLIKGSVAAVLMSVTAWWAMNILPLDKLAYNQKNAYFGVAVPVLTYIYMRNLTPLMRTHYLEPLHSLGKITLETYLMQHHIWLTSNAKTLLVVVPGHAKLNMVVVTVCYVLVSRELYRLTMSLRGMCLPDDLSACLRNLAGIAAVVVAAMGIAKGLLVVGASPALCLAVIGTVGFGVALAVHLVLVTGGGGGGGGGAGGVSPGGRCGGMVLPNDHNSKPAAGGKKEYDGRLLHAYHTVPVVALVLAVVASASVFVEYSEASARARVACISYSDDVCIEAANHGMWKVQAGECQDPGEARAYCNSHEWKWVDVPDQCQFYYRPPSEVKSLLKGRRVVVVGDSVTRFMYHALIRSFGVPTPLAHNNSVEKHADFSWDTDDGSTTHISFLWAAFGGDILTRVEEVYGSAEPTDLLIMGGGLWDVVHRHDDIDGYRTDMRMLRDKLATSSTNVRAKVWVTVTNVVPDRLITEDNRTWMTEPNLTAFHDVLESSGLLTRVDGVIDGIKLTAGQRQESYDGVHYSDLTYDAFAQVGVNLFAHLAHTGAVGKLDAPGKPFVKRIRGMGNWRLGLMVLFLASVMVLTRDAFHGMVRLALALFGGRSFLPENMTWEKTYGDLLRKIGKHPNGSSAASLSGGSPPREGGVGGRGERVRSANSDAEGETEKFLLDGGEGGGGGGGGGRSSLEMGVLRGAGSEPLR